MPRREESTVVALAGPAALLAVALLSLGARIHPLHLAPLVQPLLRAGASVSRVRASGQIWPTPLGAGAAILAALLLGLSLALRRGQGPRLGAGLLGRARRAGEGDLRRLRGGMPRSRRSGPRVRLGDHHRRSLWLPCEEHLLALGPTGSGKSSGLAIPAILEWPGPVVVTDPKGELVSSTLAHRRRLGRVAIFAPLMRPSAAWNPVASIASSEDALRVATFLMSRPPEREPFWHDLARQLLHGMLIEASQQGLTLARLLESLQVEPAETLAAKLSHPVARRLAQGALSGGERTAMGVVATLVSQLGAYGSDQVAQATAESDFDPKAMAGGGLGTLYCVVAPHDAPVLRGLVSALISCCWRGLFAAPPQPPALFVLDEFTQLTNLPELPALAQLGRSQGVRLLLMAQDLGSITATYGREAAGALWSNCATKLLLPGISELELLERVSKLAGTTTLHRGEGELSRQPVASHPLLQPDDVRRLRPGRALLLHGGDQPALIQQHRWFQDRALRRLVLPPPGGLLPAPAPGRPLRDWIEPTMAREAPTDSLRWQGGETTAA